MLMHSAHTNTEDVGFSICISQKLYKWSTLDTSYFIELSFLTITGVSISFQTTPLLKWTINLPEPSRSLNEISVLAIFEPSRAGNPVNLLSLEPLQPDIRILAIINRRVVIVFISTFLFVVLNLTQGHQKQWRQLIQAR